METALRRRAGHRAMFMFKCLKNLFTHSFDIVFNREYPDYNIRTKDNDIRLSKIGTGVFETRQICRKLVKKF